MIDNSEVSTLDATPSDAPTQCPIPIYTSKRLAHPNIQSSGSMSNVLAVSFTPTATPERELYLLNIHSVGDTKTTNAINDYILSNDFDGTLLMETQLQNDDRDNKKMSELTPKR